ncbi:MAG: thiopurine S-methyltransferase, partial [SAR324 cluster bacterium]|nr:thiopurine S-methyltransferase [SAR324 cluster bacterium]
NTYLSRFSARLLHSAPENIFVPLCGKSLDLPWLANRTNKVVGVELVSKAVEEFYAENKISHSIQSAGKLQLFKNDSIDIFQGDFFDLTQEQTGLFEAIYDRGAIVALAQSERQKYAEHLLSFLAPGGRLLLISLEYKQDQMSGPPFSVPDAEIAMLFSQYGRLELLETCDILDERLRNKGLDGILERVYQLVKN